MTLYASLDGRRVVRVTVSIPYYGAWSADVDTEEDISGTGILDLVLGDLTLRGTIVERGSFAGDRRMRMVAGAAGWRTTVQPRGYSNAAGVPVALVLGDVASEVGETLADTPTGTAGPHYARPRGFASTTLRELGGALWWVRPDGRTTFAARDTSPIVSPITVVSRDPATRRVVIATEHPVDWMPGRSFATITIPTLSVHYTRITSELSGTMRVEVLT